MEAKQQQRMLVAVAGALGPDLVKQVTFVGGCTTALLLTDEVTAEQVRHTDDVDLIVHVISYVGYSALQEKLNQRGFKIVAPDKDEDIPICAMQLGELRVDIMPDDEAILGFSNRWYKGAMENAFDYQLNEDIIIKLVSPVYFIATKLEAWLGRGKGEQVTLPLCFLLPSDPCSTVNGDNQIRPACVWPTHVKARRYVCGFRPSMP